MRRRSIVLSLFFSVFLVPALQAEIPTPSFLWERTFKAPQDFETSSGHLGSRGWELDYKRDQPGYALQALKSPLLLEPGTYRLTFILRRGHYPSRGFLHKTYTVFRIELWDLTAKELINFRDLQLADFESPNRYERRWLEFSMTGREGHQLEPRVFWNGLANGEIDSIRLVKFPEPDLRALEEKALALGDELERHHLENGFVVSRKPDGAPDETGDAVTYTGFYVASLAWKYAITKDALTYQELENGLQTLHNAIKGTPETPILVRYVDADGMPFPKNPSKDVYTAFFFAYAAAAPHLKNGPLKKQLELDADRIGTRFLKDDLRIMGGNGPLLILTPYFTMDEISDGIDKLFKDKKRLKKFIKNLRSAQRVVPFGEIWPGFKVTLRAFEREDKSKLLEMVVPTLNGVTLVAERVRDILREQYRQDLFPRRRRNQDYPGIQLEKLLTRILNQMPPKINNRRFTHLSEFRILASNALISLHVVKTAAVLTDNSTFDEYYKTNLYKQDALLQTALDWYGLEEDLMRLTAGNPEADRTRKGYLSALALYNLILSEKNPEVKKNYQDILEGWWGPYRNEDNPMAAALELAVGRKKADVGLMLKTLNEYPMDRRGYGENYWRKNGDLIGEVWGGGFEEEYSREPLSAAVRPRDSFLWQRNARRLRGDFENTYPGTDYLFVYWLARYHKIIPAPAALPTVKK